MNAERTERGFVKVTHESYVNPSVQELLIQECSHIGPYEDSDNRPGSSYLWIGEKHRLNREEVTEMVSHLQHWLNTGHLQV